MSEENITKSILFLRPGKLGDMIVATPLFSVLRSEFPEYKIAVACSPYNEIIIKNNSDIDIKRKTNFHSVIDVIRLIRWIKNQRFGWIVDLTPGDSRTTTMISKFSRGKHIRTAGMHKNVYSSHFDIVTDDSDIHIIDRNIKLLEKVTGKTFCTSVRPKIVLSENENSKARQFLDTICLKNFLIGVNLSAGAPVRQWTYNTYQDLIKRLSNEFGDKCTILLFSVGEQRTWAEDLQQIFDSVKSVPAFDFLIITALIKHLSILFTPDTSLLHVASAFSIPVVATYSPDKENYIRWRSYKIPSRDIVAPLENVNEITAETAFVKLKDLVQTEGLLK
jgi:ADP-heptose:LPS heptosyltransferase